MQKIYIKQNSYQHSIYVFSSNIINTLLFFCPLQPNFNLLNEYYFMNENSKEKKIQTSLSKQISNKKIANEHHINNIHNNKLIIMDITSSKVFSILIKKFI